MASAARGLTEPEVLAHTKRRLFPEDAEDAYAVADTQFATDTWLAGTPVAPEIRSALSPFNHVRIDSGYPDVVGVRRLESDVVVGALAEGSVYHSPTVFQPKAMLYHAGLLTERGAEPSSLDPAEDAWARCEPAEPG
jgi:hypothetical protein